MDEKFSINMRNGVVVFEVEKKLKKKKNKNVLKYNMIWMNLIKII